MHLGIATQDDDLDSDTPQPPASEGAAMQRRQPPVAPLSLIPPIRPPPAGSLHDEVSLLSARTESIEQLLKQLVVSQGLLTDSGSSSSGSGGGRRANNSPREARLTEHNAAHTQQRGGVEPLADMPKPAAFPQPKGTVHAAHVHSEVKSSGERAAQPEAERSEKRPGDSSTLGKSPWCALPASSASPPAEPSAPTTSHKDGKGRRRSSCGAALAGQLAGLADTAKAAVAGINESERLTTSDNAEVPQNLEEFVEDVIQRAKLETQRVEQAYLYRIANSRKRVRIIFSPDSSLKHTWDWLVTIAIIAALVVFPVLLGFSDTIDVRASGPEAAREGKCDQGWQSGSPLEERMERWTALLPR